MGADVWQLIRTGKLLAGRIELEAPRLEIERTGTDRFSLASEFELGGGDSSLPGLRLGDLPAGTLAIRGGVVTIAGWNAALPRFELRDVDVTVHRGESGATLAFAAHLPAALGGEVSVNATAQGPGLLRDLGWTLLVRTRNLVLAGWRELLPDYLSRLGAGRGGFEISARGQGAGPMHVDLNFGAVNVMTRLANEPSVKFDEVAGSIGMTHSGDRWTLSGRHVRALRGGRRDPESDFDVNWRDGEDGMLELHARASYLRAETLLPLAGLVPQRDLRARLQDAAPTGEWTAMQVDLLRGSTAEPWGFRVGARFRGVGFAPAGRAPG